jgi:hypothetical protein
VKLKWITTLFLLLVLSIGAIAGPLIHSTKRECPMPSCCRLAQSDETTPKAFAARMCCMMNCQQPATSGTGHSSNFSPLIFTTLQTIISQHVLNLQRRISISKYSTEVISQVSIPSYIRHSALLI